MDLDLVRFALAHAEERGVTIEEALSHWQFANSGDNGKWAGHWVSIAFGLAREQRERGVAPA